VLGVTLAFAPDGTLYMSSATFSDQGAQTGSFLHVVDPATAGILNTLPIAPAASGNLVHVGGLAIRPDDNAIFASARQADQAQKGDLWRISPAGTPIFIGATGVGEMGDLEFTVEAPIPEPATVLLLAAGLGALGLFRRRFVVR
jgi:hypothetical protein